MSILLEDLEAWGPDRIDALEKRFGKAEVKKHFKDDLIERVSTAIGDVMVLTPSGYRALGYKYQWYKPTESSILDRISLREVVRILEREGFEVLERVVGNDESKRKNSGIRSIARLRGPDGRITFALARYYGYTLHGAKTALRRLWKDVLAEDARVIVYMLRPEPLLKAWKLEYGDRVQLRGIPWGFEGEGMKV